MKILYFLWLIPLAWTAISFAGLPLWMIFTRHNRRYHRANNWSDDYSSFGPGASSAGTAAPATLPGFDGSAADNLQVVS